jgi:nucleotide-binding universal stress UspA family protein
MILPSFTRILLVTDFSDCSRAAVPFARAMAEYYGAAIFVAHIVPQASSTTAAMGPDEAHIAAAAAEAQMQEFIVANPLGEAPVETIIEHGTIADVLATVIQDKSVDLVVVGTSGLRVCSSPRSFLPLHQLRRAAETFTSGQNVLRCLCWRKVFVTRASFVHNN